MKKQFALITIVVFLLASCVSNTVRTVYDDSVPAEESALINTYVGKITSYNGVPVDWKSSVSGFIRIPAGETVLVWDIDATNAFTTYRGKNMIFAYYFKPQKKYFFWFSWDDDDENIYGLRVNEYEPEETVRQGNLNDHFVEFVPFLNNRTAGQKLILE